MNYKQNSEHVELILLQFPADRSTVYGVLQLDPRDTGPTVSVASSSDFKAKSTFQKPLPKHSSYM